MKNTFVIAGFIISSLFLSFNNTFAQATQTDPKSTDNVKVNVIFNPILSIAVNHTKVDLIFNTMEDYKNGVSTTMADHLSVFSTDNTYAVKVKTLENTFISADKSFNVSNVSVQAASGAEIALSNVEQTIYTGTQAGRDQKLSVKYLAKGADITNDQAITNSFVNKTFVANVVYTIAVN